MQQTRSRLPTPSEDMQLSMARACEQVILKFTAYFDAGEYSKMEHLFATKGVWKRQDGDINGLEHFKDWSRGRTSSIFVRHVLSNLITTVVDPGRVLVESYVTVYRQDFVGAPVVPAGMNGPALLGRYHDVVIEEGGQWKLARREVEIDFKKFV